MDHLRKKSLTICIGLAVVILMAGCGDDSDAQNIDAPAAQPDAAADSTNEASQTLSPENEAQVQSSTPLIPAEDVPMEVPPENIESDPPVNGGSQSEPPGNTMDGPGNLAENEPAGQGGETVLSNTSADCAPVGLLAPSLPEEAGHYVATIITPSAYPFAVEKIRYTPIRNAEVPSCNGGLSHRVQLFAIDAEASLPANPPAEGLGFREYEVPSAADSAEGRQVEIELPVPLILTEGQRAVIAIEFTVSGDEHLCIANCVTNRPDAGLDYWSNAAEVPFRWQDLVADFNLRSQVITQLTGRLMR